MTDEELNVLAWTLLGEAGGEGTRGLEAVAHVIRNRAASGRFPSNPASVALQHNRSGVYQFSTWNSLGNGGNIPRARYPTDGAAFQHAKAVVEKVFGPTPGADPTRGATHYYSPQGMPGGDAPYWWASEAPRGQTRIGNHIFAVKYDPKEAPTPATRHVTTDRGAYPTKGALEVLRTGQSNRLPAISAGTTRDLGKYPSGLELEQIGGIPRVFAPRPDNVTGEGLNVRQVQTVAIDPITGSVVPKGNVGRSIYDMVRKSGGSQPSKTAQRVAGFVVPDGTDGVAKVEQQRLASIVADMRLSAAQKAVGSGTGSLPVSKGRSIPSANGSVVSGKDQSRLAPNGPTISLVPQQERYENPAWARAQELIKSIPTAGLSRDAVAQRAAGIAAAQKVPQWLERTVQVPKVAPVPAPPVQRAPVEAAREPLQIEVSGANIRYPETSRYVATNGYIYEQTDNGLERVGSTRMPGESPADQYDRINREAKERAESNSSSGKSSSGRSYDPDTNSWN